jgi:hypothetical protein
VLWPLQAQVAAGRWEAAARVADGHGINADVVRMARWKAQVGGSWGLAAGSSSSMLHLPHCQPAAGHAQCSTCLAAPPSTLSRRRPASPLSSCHSIQMMHLHRRPPCTYIDALPLSDISPKCLIPCTHYVY